MAKAMEEWRMTLKNGSDFSFLISDKKLKNPLEQFNEYDKGDNWSIPCSSILKKKGYKTDPENRNCVLIPKKDVKSVYKKKH